MKQRTYLKINEACERRNQDKGPSLDPETMHHHERQRSYVTINAIVQSPTFRKT